MDKIFCGIDIGGTKCAVALVNEKGKILDKILTREHTGKSEERLVVLVVSLIRQLLRRNEIQESRLPGIGIGFAGHIRYRDGVVITTSNLHGFKNYPLRDAFQQHFSIPVILDNDTNAQAWGEHLFGTGRSMDDMVFLTVSTGIGAGIIINKKLYRGVTGTAGEFGHTIVEPESDLVCTCGNRGCLMAVASGLALPSLYKKKLQEGKKSTLSLPPDFDLSKIDGVILKNGLDTGDPLSREIILDCGYYMGVGIYNIFQALNPPLIVLGGGLTNWGDLYLEKIKSTFYELARDMIFDPIEIRISTIHGDAGLIGAAALPLE